MHQEILLKNLETPRDDGVDEEIEWLCKSFGFVSSRDKDETSVKVLHTIITALAKKHALSSEDIATTCDVSRPAILYHLKNYIASGLIVPEKRMYVLRTRSMARTIDEIELDALRIFSKLKRIAREIDESLGLE